jgi:thiamine pyrophosphate-dependent acetolactate synthase large subunit-like protein
LACQSYRPARQRSGRRGHASHPHSTKFIQVDIEPDEIGSNYPVAVGIVADAPRARAIAAMAEEWYTEFAPQMTSKRSY